jgi:hypothetical protein
MQQVDCVLKIKNSSELFAFSNKIVQIKPPLLLMRLAYLILAHRLPSQLRILIDLCQHPDVDFYIHVDKKTGLSEFREMLPVSNVFFIQNRVSCKWGTFSLVEATINGLKEIQEKGGYDYVNFISGQDLPLVTAEDFMQFLEKNNGKEFISCKPFNHLDPWWKKNEGRFLKYNFQNWTIPGKYRLQFLFNRLMPPRIMPDNLTLAGESQWFCITSALADYLLYFIRTHPQFIRYFKYVWGADEFIFSTIAYNSAFRPAVAGNLHYIDWRGPSDGHPKTLELCDVSHALASGKQFARKFDLKSSPEAIAALQQQLKNDTEKTMIG